MDRIKIIFLASFVFVVFYSSQVNAARIYFEPANNTREVGETFTVNVRLDTQGDNINAVDFGILYPPLLEIKSISKSGSAIQLWVQEPSFSSTGIFLSGGSPGGIKSSSALIAKITMKGKAIGDGNLQLTPASSALLNDGQGTNAVLNMGPASFEITAQPKKEPTATPEAKESPKPTPKQEEDDESKKDSDDDDKPKKFKAFVGQDPRVFGGKHFVSFFTTDSESGVQRYEIKEGKGNFKTAQSPYLLADQDLNTVIRIRAYDTSGNYRETVYPGALKRVWLWIFNLF